MKNKCNVFTVIGVVVAVLSAVAGIAYAVYYFVEHKFCLCRDDCYDFACEDCDEDCNECPLCAEDNEDDASEDASDGEDAE